MNGSSFIMMQMIGNLVDEKDFLIRCEKTVICLILTNNLSELVSDSAITEITQGRRIIK